MPGELCPPGQSAAPIGASLGAFKEEGSMEDHQEAMVKSLVAVAWADGRMDDEEAEVIEALLSAFEIKGDTHREN